MEDAQFLDELYEIVKQNKQEDYSEVIEKKAAYPFLYHLSSMRGNLIQWLPVRPNLRILDWNAQCGALTGILLSRASHVTAVTQTKKQADIIRERYASSEKLCVMTELEADSTWNFGGTDAFDLVLIDGEFSRYCGKLSILHRILRSDGTLLVADANRMGLKYLAGCQEEYRGGLFAGVEGYEQGQSASGEALERCFSKKEYEHILEEAGFETTDCYYPYPDHKFPSGIYSDEWLPQKGELSDNRRNFKRDRYQLFDERKVYDSLIAEGLFPSFSNSFLFVARRAVESGPEQTAGSKTDSDQPRTVYVKYSNERGPRFQIRTDIVQMEDGLLHVYKYALKTQGNEHIESIGRAYDALSKNYSDSRITFCDCKMEGGAARFSYIEGATLQNVMELALQNNDKSLIHSILADYIERIKNDGGDEKFELTEAFAAVFGDKIPDGDMQAAKVSDIDMIFSNIIVPDAKIQQARTVPWTVIDYEWTFLFPIPKLFIIYRALYFAYYQIFCHSDITLEQLMEIAKITPEQQKCFARMEEKFQRYLGKDALPVRNMQRMIGTKIKKLPELSADGCEDGSGTRILEDAWIKTRKIRFHVDRQDYQDGSFVCCGWALASLKDGRTIPVNIRVEDCYGHPIAAEISRMDREDVAKILRIRKVTKTDWGFNCVFLAPAEMKWRLVFSMGNLEKTYTVDSKIE